MSTESAAVVCGGRWLKQQEHLEVDKMQGEVTQWWWGLAQQFRFKIWCRKGGTCHRLWREMIKTARKSIWKLRKVFNPWDFNPPTECVALLNLPSGLPAVCAPLLAPKLLHKNKKNQCRNVDESKQLLNPNPDLTKMNLTFDERAFYHCKAYSFTC